MDIRIVDWRRPMWCFVSLVCAALSWFVIPASAGIRFGVQGALERTELTWKITDRTGLVPPYGNDGTTPPTGEIGLIAEVPLRGPWALTGGLAYSPLNDRQRVAYTSVPPGFQSTLTGTLRTNLQMMAVPVHIEWHGKTFQVGLGGETRYLLDANRDIARLYIYTNAPVPNLPERSQDRGTFDPQFSKPRFKTKAGAFINDGHVLDLYKRWSFAASGLVGIAFPVGRHTGRGELRWSEGLTDVSKIAGASEHTRAMQLGFGILW